MKWITRGHPRVDRVACPSGVLRLEALYAYCLEKVTKK